MPAPQLTGSVLQTILHHILSDDHLELPKRYTRKLLDASEKPLLQQLFLKRCHPTTSHAAVNSVVYSYNSVTIKETTYSISRKSSPAIAMAKWDTSLLGEPRVRIPVFSASDIYLRPVKIICFIKVPYSVGDQLFLKLFVQVMWYIAHPSRLW